MCKPRALQAMKGLQGDVAPASLPAEGERHDVCSEEQRLRQQSIKERDILDLLIESL